MNVYAAVWTTAADCLTTLCDDLRVSNLLEGVSISDDEESDAGDEDNDDDDDDDDESDEDDGEDDEGDEGDATKGAIASARSYRRTQKLLGEVTHVDSRLKVLRGLWKRAVDTVADDPERVARVWLSWELLYGGVRERQQARTRITNKREAMSKRARKFSNALASQAAAPVDPSSEAGTFRRAPRESGGQQRMRQQQKGEGQKKGKNARKRKRDAGHSKSETDASNGERNSDAQGAVDEEQASKKLKKASTPEQPAPEKSDGQEMKANKAAAEVGEGGKGEGGKGEGPKEVAQKRNPYLADAEPTERPNEAKKRDGRRVFLLNLSFQASEDDIRSVFEQAGKVTMVDIVKKKGRPRGMAFVTFENADAVAAALQLGGVEVAGRPVKVRLANKTPSKAEVMRKLPPRKGSRKVESANEGPEEGPDRQGAAPSQTPSEDANPVMGGQSVAGSLQALQPRALRRKKA
eukprot:scaffold1757_cov266-Pinguiococcus_pyrenoidosus.AAC.15